MTIKPISLNLRKRLENRRFRERFIASAARDQIAAQIREMRLKRGYTTQADFAEAAKMQQSAVSRIEQADYSGWTFRTLLKVAVALNARLRVTFEPLEAALETERRSGRAAQLQAATYSDLTQSVPVQSDEGTGVGDALARAWTSQSTPVHSD